jgi:hypothetical protein
MEAARTSETSVDNHFTRQYNPEDSSEHHTRRRENLKSHIVTKSSSVFLYDEGFEKKSLLTSRLLLYVHVTHVTVFKR